LFIVIYRDELLARYYYVFIDVRLSHLNKDYLLTLPQTQNSKHKPSQPSHETL